MNAGPDEVQLPLSNAREPAHQGTKRLTVAGAILALVMILFFTAQWPQPDSNAARATAIDNKSAAGNAVAFDYFPARFGSPATNNAPEEHIQAY